MTKIQIATVARDGARCANFSSGGHLISRPIYTGAVYEAKPRKSDGVLTWRRVGSFGGTTSGCPYNLAASLKPDAPQPWLDGVRHGQPVTVRSDWPVE